MNFFIDATDKRSKARAGRIDTDHGTVSTPVFMPVGTTGAVKAIHVKDLTDDIGAEIILGNTYHLYLRPGIEIINRAGGLHKFNGWQKPLLTDSGGYQVYSLSQQRKLTGDGVIFHSHIDGSRHFFTPESVIDIQRKIGADIIMAFDECPPYPSSRDYVAKSMELTHRWLERCQVHFQNTESIYGYGQSLFPIVQGGVFRDLRKISSETITAHEADGNAIGGLSVGEPVEEMYEITELVCSILPWEKPRYLMGVGTPANILECIALGVDMFDCVMPTRNGRNGMLFTGRGIINIKNNKWKDDFSPLDELGDSFVDLQYSRAYLRHLFAANEILGAMIASYHNLRFYIRLVQEARKKILEGTFEEWKSKMTKQLTVRL